MGGGGVVGKEWKVLGMFKLQLQLIVIISYSVVAGYGLPCKRLGAGSRGRRTRTDTLPKLLTD